MTFSKKGMIVFLSVAILCTLACLILTIKENPYSYNMINLSEVWVGGSSIYGGAYLWKTKAENKSKYTQQWLDTYGEKYGVDTVIRILDFIGRSD